MYSALALLLWTSVILLILFWHLHLERIQIEELVHLQARSAFDKDITYRRWNAAKGGLYAPINKNTPPNPYLPDELDTKAWTEQGTELTMVNPAYMTRQAHELGRQRNGIHGKITSLNPINPGNIADSWEKKALRTLKKTGEDEYTEIVEQDGEALYRAMFPLEVEKGCLPCHQLQGYVLGEQRGGIAITVPMKAVNERQTEDVVLMNLSYGAIWLIGCMFIGGAFLSAHRRFRDAENYNEKLLASNQKLQVLSESLQQANNDIDAFSTNVSQGIKVHSRHIIGYAKLLQESEQHDMSESELERMQTVIITAGQRINYIADRLRFYSMAVSKELHPTRFNISSCVLAGLEELIAEEAEQNPERRFELDIEDGILALCDIDLVKVAIYNLLNNAIRFSAGQKVTRISFSAIHRSGERVLSITDNGIGFNNVQSDRLFRPFSKGTTNFEAGVGLGLSIVKVVIERHGGRIWAESIQGEGATFYFTLPETEAQ